MQQECQTKDSLVTFQTLALHNGPHLKAINRFGRSSVKWLGKSEYVFYLAQCDAVLWEEEKGLRGDSRREGKEKFDSTQQNREQCIRYSCAAWHAEKKLKMILWDKYTSISSSSNITFIIWLPMTSPDFFTSCWCLWHDMPAYHWTSGLGEPPSLTSILTG